MKVSRKRRAREMTVASVIILALGLVYLVVLGIYRSEMDKMGNVIQVAKATNPTHMEAKVTVRSIDPARQEAIYRVEFEPQGGLSAEDGFATAFDVRLLVNATSGKQEYEFLKNKRISPVEFTVSTEGGAISEYPFDKYVAPFEMLMTASSEDLEMAEGDSGEGSEAAEAPQATVVTQVPVELDLSFDGTLAGWNVTSTPSRLAIPGYAAFDANLKRANTAVYFALFINGAIVVIALGVLLIALAVAVRGRQVELPMITLSVIVLFALPALRNFLPGQPPIGTLMDFVAFFWAQAIVAVSGLVLLACFLIRDQSGYPRRWGGKPYPPEEAPQQSVTSHQA